MSQHQLLRLQRIEVDGLFGIYDYRIDLDLNDRVTLLHGRNGVGKTTVLRMINAFLRGDILYFGRIPFTRFLLIFHDDSSLGLTPDNPNVEKNTGILTLIRKGGKKKSDQVQLWSEAEFLAARTDHLKPHSGIENTWVDSGIENTWVDIRDGEVLTEMEVLSRYGGPRREYYHQEKTPWLDEFLQNANAHLIEAQRLVRTSFDATSRGDFAPWHRRLAYTHPILTPSVVECSQDLKSRLDHAMATYGTQAQTLDQTFPQRLMTASDKISIPDIQARMERLAKKIENYKKIGILDKTAAHPFDIGSLDALDDTRASAMNLYVQDTERKLEVLDDLANRTRHLLDSLNEKFRHKELHLDREEGLIAQVGEDQNLPLRSLSSGEQHELVLHYDLLFKTRPNTVVLIDEPEISLHVAWQKKFLPDLVEIVRLSEFDAVVATHSPFIVGDRDDLMVGLGDPV